MSETSKFMFDDKFDEIGSGRSPTAKNPAISEEDLERAREQAFAEGRSAGVAATQGEIDAAIARPWLRSSVRRAFLVWVLFATVR